MTVKELIEKLNKFPEDKEVFFTLPGSKSFYDTDKVYSMKNSSCPCIECDDAPSFEDLEGMADACWDDNYRFLTESQREAIIEFSNKAMRCSDES